MSRLNRWRKGSPSGREVWSPTKEDASLGAEHVGHHEYGETEEADSERDDEGRRAEANGHEVAAVHLLEKRKHSRDCDHTVGQERGNDHGYRDHHQAFGGIYSSQLSESGSKGL